MGFIYRVDLEAMDKLRLGCDASQAIFEVISDMVKFESSEHDGIKRVLLDTYDVTVRLVGHMGLGVTLDEHPRREELVHLFNRHMERTGRRFRVMDNPMGVTEEDYIDMIDIP